jgi:hypothetical protein
MTQSTAPSQDAPLSGVFPLFVLRHHAVAVDEGIEIDKKNFSINTKQHVTFSSSLGVINW